MTGEGQRRGWGAAVMAVLGHPTLWPVALRQVFRLAAPGWWRRWPLLPLPAADYLAFRMQTAYGDPSATPLPADVVGYLRWCRAWPALARRH